MMKLVLALSVSASSSLAVGLKNKAAADSASLADAKFDLSSLLKDDYADDDITFTAFSPQMPKDLMLDIGIIETKDADSEIKDEKPI